MAFFKKKKPKIKIQYIKATEIAKHFNIPIRKINKIFENLKWAIKEDKHWIATELGITAGAKQSNYRGTKYIEWNSEIKRNFHLISAIDNFKDDIKINTTKKEIKPKILTKKEKGDMYETYVANFFKKQGYYVWEHGKEKGVHDSSIDLLVKKENYIYFVQCKNWEKWKITHKEVKATRTDVREYLKKEKMLWELIKGYDSKILYVTPTACLARSAYTYIQENSNIVEYQVIPIIE